MIAMQDKLNIQIGTRLIDTILTLILIAFWLALLKTIMRSYANILNFCSGFNTHEYYLISSIAAALLIKKGFLFNYKGHLPHAQEICPNP